MTTVMVPTWIKNKEIKRLLHETGRMQRSNNILQQKKFLKNFNPVFVMQTRPQL